jgi:hypothetical protein
MGRFYWTGPFKLVYFKILPFGHLGIYYYDGVGHESFISINKVAQSRIT